MSVSTLTNLCFPKAVKNTLAMELVQDQIMTSLESVFKGC